MRTTVDLPPAAHRRAREIAARSGRSLSSVVAELALRGLAATDHEQRLIAHPDTDFPTVSVGRTVDAEDVAALSDDQ